MSKCNINMEIDTDSDSDIEEILPPVLPLPDITNNINILQQPRDGHEYLWQVVKERKKCRNVVTAPLNKQLKNKQNVFVEEPVKTVTAPEILLPTKEWQNHQEADFSEIRCKVSRLYSKKDVWHSDIKLPFMKTNNADASWDDFFKNHEPILSTMFPMTQIQLQLVLEILIDNLDDIPPGKGIISEQGKWIFGILAILKLPLEPNTCSTLRDLARKCSLIRSRLSTDDENVVRLASNLNLFICLVAKYFRQGDLAD